MLGAKVVAKVKTHILCSTTFFPENVPFVRQCGKCGIGGEGTDDNIMRRMRFAWLIIKATNTHSKYEILIVFPLQKWLHEHAPMLRLYVHCFCYLTMLCGRYVNVNFASRLVCEVSEN